MTDYKVLCARLCGAIAATDNKPRALDDAYAEAVAALAEPEAVGLTDAELWELYQGPGTFSPVEYARAVLARWGRPAPQPVPVSERWPEFSDCDPQEKVWVWNPVLERWSCRASIGQYMPTPEATND